jgi:hypothetical protein
MSQRFIYDLAKSDLGFMYKQCLDGIDEAKKEAWRLYENYGSDNKLRAILLKTVIQAEEAKFKLLTEGPNVLAVNAMSERLERIQESFQNENR